MGDEVKRDVRQFEPPPWEREAFEALARRKAEEQAALEALAAAERAASGVAVASQAEALAAEVLAARAAASAEAPEQPAPVASSEQSEAAPATPAAPAVDERQVQVMLMELGKEETTPTRNIRLIARIASVLTGLIGLGMLIGGIFALQRASGTAVGVMGSGALSVFGMCFLAMAGWVWVRSNRLKGSR